jgi:hypothetical protein
MYKKVIDSDIVEIIGEYGIIKYKEKTFWDNGKVFGTQSGYDVALEHGEGDVVASFDYIKDARKWAKEN